MEITLDLKNYNTENSVFKRTAARGIINNGDKYLLIFSRYGDYKFPGGGMENGEELEDTLVREVEEETGYKVIKDSTKKYGKVYERRKGEYDDIMEMESYYFRCKVEEVVGSRNLDEYEEEYDYQIVWMTLPEAIEKNNSVTDLDICPWVMRDTRVMELLVKEQNLNLSDDRGSKMKYLLDVKIDPTRHYIHVTGKVENAISNTFYLNENFHMLYAKVDNTEIGFTIDKAAPYPPFDSVSRPLIFDTEAGDIQFEYEGYIPEIIADVNQINEETVELAYYAGWYPKPAHFGITFDYDIKIDLPDGYELASNGKIEGNTQITSTDKDNEDIVIFASNKVQRFVFDEGAIKLTFLCPDEMIPSMSNRAKDIVKANSYFTEKYGEIQSKSSQQEIISVFRPRGGWGYKRGNASFMSYEFNENEKYTGDFHELAHGWWSSANTITDDWINEGGAEFSAYAASKYIYGNKYADTLIGNYMEQINNSDSKTSIVDTTASSPDRHLNHYIKTTMMFIHATKYFGEDKVFELLKSVYIKYAGTRNATTGGFLDLCEPNMKIYFEKVLFTKSWKEINFDS